MGETLAWTNATPAHAFGRVLRPGEFFRTARYGHAAPAPELRRWVRRYWSVTWELAPGVSFPVATLSEPTPNLTVERGGTVRDGATGEGEWFTGPVSAGRFDVTLTGRGSVLGVKFALGGALAFAPVDLRSLRDRTVRAADVMLAPPDDLPADAAAAAPALDVWLAALGPSDPPGLDTLTGLLRMLEDPGVTSLDELALRSGQTPRTVQRLFRRLIGVGPKRMLVRARVMDAVAALDAGHDGSLADLAHRLGWFDQAHFARDFRAVTGQAPRDYEAGSREPSGTGRPRR